MLCLLRAAPRCEPRLTGTALRSWWRCLSAVSAASTQLEAQQVVGVIPIPPVQVAYTAEDIDRAVARSFAARPIFVGVDIEYRPTFQKDAPLRRTALVQLASADACVLAHLHALPHLPPGLRALLEDPAVYKVGTGVVGDLDKLASDFQGLHPASYVDLAVVAKLFRYERTGMKSMSAAFGAEVVKSKQIQLSNWEEVPLSAPQVAYAAEDAALGLWLLDKLHAAHGGGAALRDWVAVFLDAPSPDALANRPAASLGPLRMAVAAYAAAAAAAEAALHAQKLDRRQQAALQAGLADAALAVSSLTNLAAARGQTVIWTDVVRNIKGRVVVESSCKLGGERLAHARGNSRAVARRDAAFAALQRLASAAATAQGDADDAENLVP